MSRIFSATRLPPGSRVRTTLTPFSSRYSARKRSCVDLPQPSAPSKVIKIPLIRPSFPAFAPNRTHCPQDNRFRLGSAHPRRRSRKAHRWHLSPRLSRRQYVITSYSIHYTKLYERRPSIIAVFLMALFYHKQCYSATPKRIYTECFYRFLSS